MAADELSPSISDEEETNDRRGAKRPGQKKFCRSKYEKIKVEADAPGELGMSQKLAKLKKQNN